MKRRRVTITADARDEVAAAFAYIEQATSYEAALHWLEGLERLIHSLEEMPERFPIALEDRHFPHGTLRRALHFNHRVLFTIDENHVQVLHIRHGMRDELTEP